MNFDQSFELEQIRFGSDLEKMKGKDEIRHGKEDSRFLTAEGIHLFYEEEGEDIEVPLKTPRDTGEYPFRLTAHTAQGGYEVKRFKLTVDD